MVQNEQTAALLQDGTFIRKNRVYTISKYSTVILLLKILLSRQENTALLSLAADQENNAPYEVVRQIIDNMLSEYDESCAIEAVNPEDHQPVPGIISLSRSKLQDILFES